MTYEEALTYLTAHGQQHLLRYYPTLTLAQQKHLLEQISNLHWNGPSSRTAKRQHSSGDTLHRWGL